MRRLFVLTVCFLGGAFQAAPADPVETAKILYVSTVTGNADIFITDSGGKGQPINLTRHEAHDLFAAWSPDGKHIVFASDRDGAVNLYVMDADGKNVRQLTMENSVSRGPAWSPDGKKIAFTRHVANNVEIFVMDADGQNAVNITNDPHYDADPAWSPDSKRIVFASARDNVPGFRLYIMDADGSNLKEVTKENNTAGFVYPAWSPDGKTIVFAHPTTGGMEIFAIAPDGSNRRQLTKLGGKNSYAAWSADGAKIAFYHGDGERSSLYVMNADGGNPREVLANAMIPEEGGRIAWKPK
jgi:TolB protein